MLQYQSDNDYDENEDDNDDMMQSYNYPRTKSGLNTQLTKTKLYTQT